MDTIAFNEFNTTGVLGTDTFETWRQKTNGIIDEVAQFDSVYATKNQVVTLSDTQTITGSKTFSNGLTITGNGGIVPLTTNSASELVLTNNVLIDSDKSLSAASLESRSGNVTIAGKTYQWPTLPEDQGAGYVYTNNVGAIEFVSIETIADEVVDFFADASLVATQEITPVGTVIGVKLTPGAASSILDNVWLKCDGSTVIGPPPLGGNPAYPDLYEVLGTQTVPNLNSKVLIGASAPTGFIGATGASGPSYYDVYYYIKAVKDNVTTFSLNSGNGISLSGQNGSPSINIYGGNISLNTGSEFAFNVNKQMSIANASISHTKLQNASTSITTGNISIPLSDTNGHIRGNTPGVSSATGDGLILANKAYVDGRTESKDHKIRALNARGFNSYGVQPTDGCVFVNYDNRVKAYGLNNDNRGRRYGLYDDSDARGHSLPLYDKNVKKVYSDTSNTYIMYDDNRVYSYGLNNTRKSGTVEASANTTYLTGPKIAFGGDQISEVILSYDLNAATAYALTSDGRLWVAGSNQYGQLGLNSTIASTSNSVLPSASFPASDAAAPNGRPITKAWIIGNGQIQTGYVLANDNTLWACGYGQQGQMGRINVRETNRRWVPVLNEVPVSYTGGTTSFSSGVYTSTNPHGLQDYDVIKCGANYFVVKINLNPSDPQNNRKFRLHENDSIELTNNYPASQLASIASWQVHKRMTDIADAAFGGFVNVSPLGVTNKSTFGYLQKTDGTLYAWGYGGEGQLGNGSAVNKSVPTLVPLTSADIKSKKVYTGLDHAVHFVSTTDRLYACGDNSFGQLGLGVNTANQNAFTEISITDLSNAGLPITGNSYTVHKFFSTGTNCRFCVFQSGTNRKLTAWGANYYNKLGGDNTAASYNKPRNVYVENDNNVADVQTTSINGGNTNIATLIIQDDDQEYGDLHTCGYHHYNVGNAPNATVIPYFTKVKNI
jgi:alpha-tubulin suppressor-like RCC1 family protein